MRATKLTLKTIDILPNNFDECSIMLFSSDAGSIDFVMRLENALAITLERRPDVMPDDGYSEMVRSIADLPIYSYYDETLMISYQLIDIRKSHEVLNDIAQYDYALLILGCNSEEPLYHIYEAMQQAKERIEAAIAKEKEYAELPLLAFLEEKEAPIDIQKEREEKLWEDFSGIINTIDFFDLHDSGAPLSSIWITDNGNGGRRKAKPYRTCFELLLMLLEMRHSQNEEN